MTYPVHVIGVSGNGAEGLPLALERLVAGADLLVGGARHHALFPSYAGERVVLRDVDAVLERVLGECDRRSVAFLASGDPNFFGIARRLYEVLPPERVVVHPAPSSMQLAFARARIPWDDAFLMSVHGRPLDGVVAKIAAHEKIGIFTDARNSPPAIARELLRAGVPCERAVVCEDLDTPSERVRAFALAELADVDDLSPTNVLIVVRGAEGRARRPTIPYLHEDAYLKRMPKKGLITKREVRMLSIAALALRPDSVVWDIGAASGSVGIECGLIAPEGRVFGIERDAESVEHARENARVLGAFNVEIVHATAPDGLDALPAPNAVFIGGTSGRASGVIRACWDALRPGGRLVMNAITLESLGEYTRALAELGAPYDVTLVSVSRSQPIAHLTRLEALNPIFILASEKG